MVKLTVITREVSPAIAKCELTHIAREPINYEKVVKQHDAYVAIFEKLLKEGYDLELIRLPALADHPDCMFTEDVAMIYDGCAIVSRCGAASRRGENAYIARLIEFLRPGHTYIMKAPAHTDGGDIFPVGKYIFVGQSTRTNDEAFTEIERITSQYSFIDKRGNRHPYECVRLPVKGVLHGKSIATALTDFAVILNTKACAADIFTSRGIEVLAAPEGEEEASNVLSFCVNQMDGSKRKRIIVISANHPKTAALIRDFAEKQTAAGHCTEVIELENDEIGKAEGALTCLSLLAYHKVMKSNVE